MTLIPVQGIESLSLFAIALWIAFDLGSALVIYLTAYAAIRFALEFARGDARPYSGRLSEAQWTAMIVATGTAIATRTPACITVAAAMIVVALIPINLTDADTVARALHSLRQPHTECVARAGGRLRISCGEEEGFAHYTLSSHGLTMRAAKRVARLLRHLGGHRDIPALVAGRPGIFHVVFAMEERR